MQVLSGLDGAFLHLETTEPRWCRALVFVYPATVALKSRSRTLGTTGCACLESVVTTRKRRRLWLCNPCSHINRATRLWLMRRP
jgi:hypothetical protein